MHGRDDFLAYSYKIKKLLREALRQNKFELLEFCLTKYRTLANDHNLMIYGPKKCESDTQAYVAAKKMTEYESWLAWVNVAANEYTLDLFIETRRKLSADVDFYKLTKKLLSILDESTISYVENQIDLIRDSAVGDRLGVFSKHNISNSIISDLRQCYTKMIDESRNGGIDNFDDIFLALLQSIKSDVNIKQSYYDLNRKMVMRAKRSIEKYRNYESRKMKMYALIDSDVDCRNLITRVTGDYDGFMKNMLTCALHVGELIDIDGNSLLHEAVNLNNIKGAVELIQMGADPFKMNFRSETPFDLVMKVFKAGDEHELHYELIKSVSESILISKDIKLERFNKLKEFYDRYILSLASKVKEFIIQLRIDNQSIIHSGMVAIKMDSDKERIEELINLCRIILCYKKSHNPRMLIDDLVELRSNMTGMFNDHSDYIDSMITKMSSWLKLNYKEYCVELSNFMRDIDGSYLNSDIDNFLYICRIEEKHKATTTLMKNEKGKTDNLLKDAQEKLVKVNNELSAKNGMIAKLESEMKAKEKEKIKVVTPSEESIIQNVELVAGVVEVEEKSSEVISDVKGHIVRDNMQPSLSSSDTMFASQPQLRQSESDKRKKSLEDLEAARQLRKNNERIRRAAKAAQPKDVSGGSLSFSTSSVMKH